MGLLGQSSFQIQQIVDGKTLTFALTPSAHQQIESKDPSTFLPNFATTNLTITPLLMISGGGGVNQISSAPSWFINGTAITATTSPEATFGAKIETSGAFRLVISKNLSYASSIIVKAVYDYTDPVTGATTQVVAQVPISKLENAGKPILCLIQSPEGDSFQTKVAGQEAAALPLVASLIRGGAEDTTNVTYKWSVLGANGTYYEITGATAPAGAGLPSGNIFSGAGTKTLTVSPAAVINIGTFRCEIKDTDSSSTTYSQTATNYFTLWDATDPYLISVDQPQGDGVTASSSSDAVFNVYQKGEVISSAAWFNGKTIKFYRLTAAKVADAAWAPTFAGWTVSAGIVSRAFSAGSGTEAARTLTFRKEHLLTTQPITKFIVQLEG